MINVRAFEAMMAGVLGFDDSHRSRSPASGSWYARVQQPVIWPVICPEADSTSNLSDISESCAVGSVRVPRVSRARQEIAGMIPEPLGSEGSLRIPGLSPDPLNGNSGGKVQH